jgi:hypothetical protein
MLVVSAAGCFDMQATGAARNLLPHHCSSTGSTTATKPCQQLAGCHHAYMLVSIEVGSIVFVEKVGEVYASIVHVWLCDTEEVPAALGSTADAVPRYRLMVNI